MDILGAPVYCKVSLFTCEFPKTSYRLSAICQVCSSFVPRKNKYNPSICEACKKFFTRTSRRHEKLICQNGNQQCAIDGSSRRFCTSCRYAKCLTVGMRCRLITANGEYANGSSEDNYYDCDYESDNHYPYANSEGSGPGSSAGSSPTAVAYRGYFGEIQPEPNAVAIRTESKIVCDPILFDGALAENTLRVAAKAVTCLHGLEFMPLRNYNGPISDILTFWQLTLRQLFEATSIGFTYGRELSGPELLYENEVNILIAAFLPAMSITYNMLPNNQGAAFIGINDQHMPQFFSYFPGFVTADKSMRELGAVVRLWNPTFPEYALFVAFCLFRLANISSDKIHRLRRRLLMIFNLHMSQTYGEQRCYEAQCYFKKCFRLLQKSIGHLHEGIAVMSAQLAELVANNDLYKEVLLTDPSQTKLGILFPKPPEH